MLSIRKPSDESIRGFLAAESKRPFTYSSVGSSVDTPPTGYVVDHTRIRLGEGEPIFHAARAAFQRWEQFRLGWVEVLPPETPIRAGEVVAVLANVIGLWWLNSSRIIYVVDESGPITRYGFAYGTLPGHVESGEERFLIEWNRDDNTVWYDILAFSRPNHIFIRLGYPLVRRIQKQFARDSVASMMRAVRSDHHSNEIP